MLSIKSLLCFQKWNSRAVGLIVIIFLMERSWIKFSADRRALMMSLTDGRTVPDMVHNNTTVTEGTKELEHPIIGPTLLVNSWTYKIVQLFISVDGGGGCFRSPKRKIFAQNLQRWTSCLGADPPPRPWSSDFGWPSPPSSPTSLMDVALFQITCYWHTTVSTDQFVNSLYSACTQEVLGIHN